MVVSCNVYITRYTITINIMKKVKNIYDKSIQYDSNCTCIDLEQHKLLMKGSKKANGKKIRFLIKKQIPSLYNALLLDYFNPFGSHSKRTSTHFIYVHSSIEYFLKIL